MGPSWTMVGRRSLDILSRDMVAMTARLNTRYTGRSAFSTTATVLSQSRQMKRHKEAMLAPKVATRQQHERIGGYTSSKIPMFLPGTFVLPLASKLPRKPAILFSFLKSYIKTASLDTFGTWLAKLGSKPSFFARPIFKLANSSVVATAKGLHRSMSEALASGDKETIRKVCADRMADTLCGTIDSRPAGKKYAWELIKYTKKMRYPRIMSQKIAKIEKGRDAPLIRQVVVRICSRQRRVELDRAGNPVEGTEKEADLVENLVLTTVISPVTWKSDEWRITGTFKDTTPESWEEHQKLTRDVEREEAAKHKIDIGAS
ncbi:hypothetical protein V8F20_000837 [Naviculisporaceae sp. PSN 640]